MLCPEGAHVQIEAVAKESDDYPTMKSKQVPAEGTGSLELRSFKNLKTWKKSITNFFRNQLRSTKSNDGDGPSESKERFDEKEISSEQKWQSLGKVFRRQAFVEHWNKSPNQQGECSSPNKRLAMRKVLTSYFGKSQKSMSTDNEK